MGKFTKSVLFLLRVALCTQRSGVPYSTLQQNENQDIKCQGFACQIFQTSKYCAVNATDPDSDLDPDKKCSLAEKRAPFSVCKNNCPGVGALGVIADGGLGFLASAFVGQALLSTFGTIGAVGLAGVGVGSRSQICMCPFCRAPFCCTRRGQRCEIQTVRGIRRCPSMC